MTERRRYRGLTGPDAREDVDDELEFHIEMRARELEAQGETPERARELALRRFGNYDHSHRECVQISERRGRRMSRMRWADEFRSDVAFAARALRRAPGFALVAVLTLALGVGANSAIFSVVNAVLLESLPYRDADRLHSVGMLYPDGTVYYSLSAPDFMSVRQDTRVFEQIEAYSSGTFTLLGQGEPKEVRGGQVSDGLFDMLGMGMALGRGFDREEHVPGAGSVAILDHGFWQRELGGDPGVLSRTLLVGGDPYTVVGVLAPGAKLPQELDMYAPLEYDEQFSATAESGRRGEYLSIIGRALPNLDDEAVLRDLQRIGVSLQQAFPATNERLTFAAVSLRSRIIGDVRTPLLVLLGAVGFVLLVACANVANLLLARASGRSGELAVRAAMGAGRGRLVRQLLTEAVVLGVAGGVVGLLIAYWGVQALVGAQPADIPRLEAVRINGAVLAFTFAVAIGTSLVFGMLPAIQATGDALHRSLREGGRGSGGSRAGNRVRSGLVVAEMALAVVLLMGAGLLIRSFVELTRVDPGFRSEQAVSFRLTMQGEQYGGGEQLRARFATLTERLEALPGVTSVGATTILPLSGLGSVLNFEVQGAEPPPESVNREIAAASVSPGYFNAIGVGIMRGRGFDDRDHAEAPRVAIINQAAARRWFAGQDPIGRVVTVGSAEPEIVGIVPDVLQRNPGEAAEPQLFRPYAQYTTRTLRVVVRTTGDPLALAPAVRNEIRALDPELPIGDFALLDELVSASVARPRFYTSLLTLFAGVALMLAATGIFGVMSYAVAQRSRELSIRMALGARRGDVLGMVVGRAMLLAATGTALGIIGAGILGRVIRSQLYGVRVFDPLTLAAVVLVLVASAALASWLPARRAALVDPGSALR